MPQNDGDIRFGVTADASGLADDITKQTKGQAEKSGSTIGGLVGKGLKFGATAAAGGIAAVLTGAFVKGFTRLTSIDSAKAKLEGLGYTGKTLQGVMDNALNSVKGTAFGLDEAVSAVPGLLAAGVKPGKDLEQALKNMASAATLGGTSFAEVADVFGDAAAAGSVTTDVMNRLEQRGIPAMANIAKSLGVTREEAKKMTSEGKISFQQLQDSLTESIGPAALAAGNSFQGMLANIMAALGRLGAEILGPVFNGLKTIMPSVIAAFDDLTAVLKPLMAQVGPQVAKAFERIKEAIEAVDWTAVGNKIKDVVQLFIDWAPAIYAVVGAFVAFKIIQGVNAAITATQTAIKGAQTAMAAYRAGLTLTSAISAGLQAANYATAASVWASTVAFLASPVTWIVLGIIALIAAIVLLVLNWDKVTKFLQDVWAGFIDWFTGVMDGFLSWWDGIWSSISKFVQEAVDNVVKWVQENWGLLLSFLIGPLGLAIQWIVENWAQISQVFIDVWNNIVAFFQPAVDVFANIFRVLGETLANIWLIIRAVFKVAWDGIVAVVTPIVTALSDFFTTVFTAVSDFFTTTWTAISDFFKTTWESIKAFISPIIEAIAKVITTVITAVKAVWDSVWGAVSDYFAKVWLGMKIIFTPIINAIKGVISGTLSTIQGLWNSVWGAVKATFQSIWDGIKRALDTAIQTVLGVFRTLKDKILAPLAGAANWLYDIGKQLIEGLVNGIKDMVGRVTGAISDVVNGAIDWAKNILGEHSPSRVFDAIGTDLGKGFVNGIDSMASEVQSAVGGLAVGAVQVAGTAVGTVAGGGTSQPAGNTDNSRNMTVEAGAFQIAGPDPYAVSLLTVNRIAEKVGI